jgi:hypothetical protein
MSRTLSVLLAMVVVAGVFLGVFLNTVAYLQGETIEQETDGELTNTEPAASINDPNATAVEASDWIGDDGDPVAYELRMEVRGPPNASEIDLTGLRIEIQKAGTGIYEHVSRHVDGGELRPEGDDNRTNVVRGVFFLWPVGVEEIDGTLVPGDRYEIVVPVGVFIAEDRTPRTSPADDRVAAAPPHDHPDAVAGDVFGLLDEGTRHENSGFGLLEPGDGISVTVATESGVEELIELQFRPISGMTPADQSR